MTRPIALVLIGHLLCFAPAAHAAPAGVAGLWEGVFHTGRGENQALLLVLSPRGPAGFDGMMYLAGSEFGPVEEGRIAGDSLSFRVAHFPVRGRMTGDRLSMDLFVPHGDSHHVDLTHTSADTTRPPASLRPVAAPPPVARDHAPDSVYRAHALPRGATSSLHPCLQRGTLILVGGGPGQKDIDGRFVELAGGPDARIVVVPTASLEIADSAEVARWGEKMAGVLGVKHVTVLHTLSRREADSEAFVAPLRTASGVWFSGGEGSWLLDSYLGTRTERELIALLDRGGVISGTSAGALVWGSTMMTFKAGADDKPYAGMRAEDLAIDHPHGSGFGLLRNVMIAPHFTQYKLEAAMHRVVEADTGLLGIGIDEATALEVHGSTGRVIGREKVSIYAAADRPPVVLEAGARYDLVKRARQ
jgi:cyanophycinase